MASGMVLYSVAASSLLSYTVAIPGISVTVLFTHTAELHWLGEYLSEQQCCSLSTNIEAPFYVTRRSRTKTHYS